ncbi:M28 family peptidase [Thalassotalea marina]|uniref:Carboxypeptidase Q n=1 Tax=Thalassotalea marina TaxID=1673741 RepID=A0A919BSJ2_9GAMM|nr:M28 family peptidase [Thalassotalea marina]GHG08500.1 peptidase M28 [Thalassotalea marina]
MTKLIPVLCILLVSKVSAQTNVDLLVEALAKPTPIISDLQQLTDEVGARLTGTQANNDAVKWAVSRFKQAGVSVNTEEFLMPRGWQEISAKATVTGESLKYDIPIATMPFTKATSEQGLSGDLVFLGFGTKEDFSKHQTLKNKWLVVQTAILDDKAGINGLFKEYVDFVGIEDRAEQAKSAGIIYMSSRDKNLLYRHLPSDGADNKLPIVVVEREEGLKLKRLLAKGKVLNFTSYHDMADEASYPVQNVIAEIKGSELPEQIILIGAHIDSFDLGTGALDNGSNVCLVIDLARQIKKLGIKPKRTIRFALYNGEEQGIYGSLAYTRQHKDELNNHVMTATIDIGTGKINGFYTNGRTDFNHAINKALTPVESQGPFSLINHPVVGTDNYDFMMNGVPNIVASQQDANYASNYHAESDTFDKVDQKQLKQNSVVMGALILGLAELPEINWQKHTFTQVEQMVKDHNIEDSMKTFGLYKSWKNKTRPMRP